MLLKSDKKEKLSWVQTDCLCSQVPKENALPEIFSVTLSAATFPNSSDEIKLFSLPGGGVCPWAVQVCVRLCVSCWLFLVRNEPETNPADMSP